jgi:zinc/manganese transport system ATP-binding protein
VGLAGRLGRPISEISVGELQRALFARLILQDPAVVLLDEPFAAVDTPTMSVLLEQVMRWHQEGRTVIAVLHDLDLVQERFPLTLVLAQRCVAWGATEAALPAMAA